MICAERRKHTRNSDEQAPATDTGTETAMGTGASRGGCPWDSPAQVAELLDEDPAVTLATVQERIGLSHEAAAGALARLRGERVADLLQTEPTLSPQEAATRLGYPVAVQRTALVSAAIEVRTRRIRPYLRRVADALVDVGLAEEQDIRVHRLDGDVLAAVVLLNGPGTPALVWDERYGWRTAVSRRHPIGTETGAPPTGDGIRYLSEDRRPDPAELLAALTDRRRGSRQPKTLHPAPAGRFG
ncbi:DUF6292 family protein [Streptomyces aureocirculatus]|uniref:DUF6292 family protein n=1 Tax=Streptomyces aureocirculatus TaxID=67275 RepID=UPI000A7012EA|nr:DUF6292 family protein [Streptomyces aureocirculatus]